MLVEAPARRILAQHPEPGGAVRGGLQTHRHPGHERPPHALLLRGAQDVEAADLPVEARRSQHVRALGVAGAEADRPAAKLGQVGRAAARRWRFAQKLRPPGLPHLDGEGGDHRVGQEAGIGLVPGDHVNRGDRRRVLRPRAPHCHGARLRDSGRRHGVRGRAPALFRHEGPVVEVEDHGRVVALARAVREGAAGLVLGGDRAQAQEPDIVAADIGRLQHLAPGIDRVAGKQRRHVAAGIDAGDREGVGRAR